MSTTPDKTIHDWTRFDAMTEAERHAAALSDPDNPPLTEEDFNRMKRTPQVKIIRRALRLSQEEFSGRFHIPLGTLRDWEQGRKEPDTAARAYLKVIGRNPQAVMEALQAVPT
jgi:putative transcriptional regulator